VPETAMDEDDRLGIRKMKVRPPWQVLRVL
jgi:hypothetical protein